MKQEYLSPALSIYQIIGKEALMEPSSMSIGGTVDNESDIGFVKGDRGPNRGGGVEYGVWGDDWSKQ